jgi:ABC-type oligopeptide transport system substrate-binding subunit
MRRSRVASVVALGAAATLMLAACGGGGGETSPDGGGAAAGGGTYSININSDPENPLVPGNTTESEGAQVVRALFTPLVEYDNATVEITYTGVAESIESEDNTNWTVTLKDGWTFHDGTPVDARSFVDAWNYTANVENAQGGAYFFEKIAGYDAENPKPAMEGLQVVDDLSFTVQLSAPFSQFPIMTGYTAFAPLPQAFFESPEPFRKTPMGGGNGPVKARRRVRPPRASPSPATRTTPARTPHLRLGRVPGHPGRQHRLQRTAGNNLDVVPRPSRRSASPPAKDELGDTLHRGRAAAGFDYLGFPTYDPRFEDKRVRQAFSMAMRPARPSPRPSLFRRPRAGLRRHPAGHRRPPPDACEYCKLRPGGAQQLLAESGFDTSQPVELWFNSGAGHDAWVQAVGNQLQQNLGITYSLRGDLDFAQYLPLADEQGMTGPFRLGWGMDYPSPENFLGPLFTTGAQPPAGSNSSFYSNPEFDRLVAAGNQAASNEEAVSLYQQADDILLTDLPVMPMFFSLSQGGHSESASTTCSSARSPRTSC